jgi:hypothetical protein
MNKLAWLAAVAALLALPTSVWSQQNDPGPPAQAQTQAGPAPQASLAEAARKAREQKRETPKSSKTFTNDNLPTEGGISTVGDKAATPPSNEATAPVSGGQTATDEKTWRSKFASLRHKLEQDQANLDVMQRELGQLNVQYYSDPTKTMQQELTRTDINNKVADIDKMKSQIEADQQAIADAEDELRKSGGDPGWAR